MKEIKRYVLRRFGEKSWQDCRQKLGDTLLMLGRHPLIGRVPPELEALGMHQYRQLLSGMNRIVYELRDDAAYIHLVCDTRRDLRELLMRRLLGRS